MLRSSLRSNRMNVNDSPPSSGRPSPSACCSPRRRPRADHARHRHRHDHHGQPGHQPQHDAAAPRGPQDQPDQRQRLPGGRHPQFTLQVTGIISSSYRLEAWVGSGDCSPLTARNGANTSICWPVLPARHGAEHDADEHPCPRHRRVPERTAEAILYSETDEGVRGAGDARPDQRQPLLLFLDGANNPGAQAHTQLDIDMVGPEAPNDVRAGEADRAIVANWTPVSTSGSDLTGYNVYCSPVDEISRRTAR